MSVQAIRAGAEDFLTNPVAREKGVGPGAIAFSYNDKLSMVEGTPVQAPPAMRGFQDNWNVSHMNAKKNFQDNWNVSYIKNFQDNWNTSYMN
jgi:hypothetical protein